MIKVHHFPDPEEALKSERQLIERFRDPLINYQIMWWTTSQSLIAPRSMKRQPDLERAIDESASRGWPVCFRQTGGDITPQGKGLLNIALAFALDPVEQPTISSVYQMFCAPMLQWISENGVQVCTGFVPGSFCDGEYNIVAGNRKVGGTAQRWTRIRTRKDESRQIVFAHALLLLDSDLNASVSAINQLYKACRMDRTIQVQMHTNLGDILLNPVTDWQNAIVLDLHRQYSSELSALTS